MQWLTPRLADLDLLYQLDQRCFVPELAYSRAEIRRLLLASNTYNEAAFDGDTLAGFILSQLTRNRGHVITIDVAPPFRRSGLGRQLMARLEAHYLRRGAAGMRLEVAVNNAGAMRFYVRLGYRVLRPLPGYYAADLDGLLMGKEFAGLSS